MKTKWTYEEPNIAVVAAPVIDVSRGSKYYAFDDRKYATGTFEVVAEGNSLEAVIAESRRSKRQFRVFQYNQQF